MTLFPRISNIVSSINSSSKAIEYLACEVPFKSVSVKVLRRATGYSKLCHLCSGWDVALDQVAGGGLVRLFGLKAIKT